MIEIKVGSKGELFLPKNLREQLNLKPGDQINIKVFKHGIFIEKSIDLLDLLELPPIGSLESSEDIEEDLEEIQTEQIELSRKEHNHE